MKVRPVWVTATILAIVVLLAQVAGAASRSPEGSPGSQQATTASVSTGATDSALTTLALPSQASSTAVEKSANGLDTASAARAGQEESAQTSVRGNSPLNLPSAANPTDSTTGARPGWGCGDTNHTHLSGPPGRPNATPPPGCSRP